MKKFTTETMQEILIWTEEAVTELHSSDTLRFQIPNPDDAPQHYAGALMQKKGSLFRHHSWRAWNDLATLLFCRILTPEITDKGEAILSLQTLDRGDSFHHKTDTDHKEKYGTDPSFALIDKNEEPAFLFAYRQALKQVKIKKRRNILDLGINSGDEFRLIRTLVDQKNYGQMNLIGIDHSQSAIDKARESFPEENVTLYCHDINQLKTLDLPRSNLILSIGTLQSPGIDFKPLFMSLIQNYLTPDGAVILGFPNCRWIDGEMIYGAKAPNYNFSEMSLVIKDIYFCKKYLQQHKFRVTTTGKEYLFLTATKIGL